MKYGGDFKLEQKHTQSIRLDC